MNLVVDIGQSGSRAKIDEKIITLSHFKNASESLIQTLEKIYSEIGNEKFSKVYLSLTGLQGNVGDERPFGELTRNFFSSSDVAVMDDGIAAYAGAVGLKSGVVLTLGGGVVAISSHKENFGHADGKGPIFGDFGGGFWIGQTALRKAIATRESRDSSFDLIDIFSKELALYDALTDKTGVDASKLCIEAARAVCVGAESGISSAVSVLKEGADYLAKTIIASWRQVNSDSETIPVVALLGGLSKSNIYVDLIKDSLSSILKYEYVEPAGDHLDGAPIIAERFPEGFEPLLKWWHN